jgi:predicted DCC family thiol-disulfide oxidoreductase YuxK
MNDEQRHLILYDGICGLCNRMNLFVLRHDPTGLFNFAPLQGALGHSLLRELGQDPTMLDTFYVIADYRSEERRIMSKAEATLFVATHVSGIPRLAAIFKALPNVVLNGAYDLIARHRYRLFGRSDVCPLPEPEYRERFIDL